MTASQKPSSDCWNIFWNILLFVSCDNVAQYVSNTKRANGVELIKSLLQRWEAGRADIPAHYNPDLTKGGAA